MPTYEFRCRACGATFTESRPMAQSQAPASCPHGHDDTVRLLDVAGVAGVARGRGRRGAPTAAYPESSAASGAASGGGCCGGSCGCG